MARPNKAKLNLQALRHNIGVARSLAPNSKVMAVVKANAYGHGAVTIAGVLQTEADALAVACIEEAIELRDAGITAPILLLEGVFEAQELVTAAQHGFWVTIDNEQKLRWLELAQLPQTVNCWLKIDTGMHRLGITATRAEEFYQRLCACKQLAQEPVCYTHFASADELNSSLTRQQISLFEETTEHWAGARSAANSPGLLGWPDSHFDWVRPGYMLYGNSPFTVDHPDAARLQPVMTLTSGIISLRDVAPDESVGYGASWVAQRPSRIATVTIGYGDGYPRLAPSGTPVLVKGQRAPLAGRVSMDMITVDVTDLPDVQVGDEVTLWGEGLPVGEVATHAGTIGYELTTRMPARTPRVVVQD